MDIFSYDVAIYFLKLSIFIFLILVLKKIGLFNILDKYNPKKLLVYNGIILTLVILIIVILESFRIEKLYIALIALIILHAALKGYMLIQVPYSKYSNILIVISLFCISYYFCLRIFKFQTIYIVLAFTIAIKHIDIEYV